MQSPADSTRNTQQHTAQLRQDGSIVSIDDSGSTPQQVGGNAPKQIHGCDFLQGDIIQQISFLQHLLSTNLGRCREETGGDTARVATTGRDENVGDAARVSQRIVVSPIRVPSSSLGSCDGREERFWIPRKERQTNPFSS